MDDVNVKVENEPQRKNKSSDSGGDTPDVKALLSPPGVLRMLVWLCAVVSFSSMADLNNWDALGDSAKFLVAAGVLTWLYCTAMLVVYVMHLDATIDILPLVELVCDLVFFIFEFAAGIAVAKKCNDSVPGGSRKWCEGEDKPKAAAVFALLASLFILGNAYFAYVKRQR